MKLSQRVTRMPIEEKAGVLSLVMFSILVAGAITEPNIIRALGEQYGLIGLLGISFIGSTIFFVFPAESIFPVLLASGIDPTSIVITATIGATLGTCVNYALGFLGSKIVKRSIDEKKLEKAKSVMNKYGLIGLFVAIGVPLPIPVPVDMITLLPGITRVPFLNFFITVTAAKIFKYTLFTSLFSGMINIF